MEPIPVFQGDIVEFTHGKYPKNVLSSTFLVF